MSIFSKAEQEAMRQRAEELRAERGGKKKADWLDALREAIDAMDGADKAAVLAVKNAVDGLAPDLTPRTWYGFPAWEKDGSVLLFVQPRAKFGARYATLGFNDNAALDDGPMWPTSYAIDEVTPDVEKRIRALVATAAGGDPTTEQ